MIAGGQSPRGRLREAFRGAVPFGGVAPNGTVPRLVRGVAASIWLVYLVLPLRAAFGHGHSVLYSAGVIVLATVFAAIYLFLTVICAPVWAGPRRVTEAAFGMAFAIALVTTLIYGSAAITMWLFVAASAAWGVRDQRRAVLALAATTVCYLILGGITHLSTGNYLSVLLPVVLAGVAGLAIRRRMAMTKQLTQARDEVERMAASAERLRLARDMHDLTGQSLSMITLKSELTARIIERLPPSPDRDRAVDEIGQIAAVSRQTLHDIRQAVSGYRRPTLAVEVITARNALESARITPHDDSQVTLASGTFDPEAEAALAWCLREAVTNVVRHSGAQNCHISLTKRTRTIALEIRDDGRCLGPADEADESAVQVPIATSTAPSCGPDWPGGGTIGTGLHGMSERLAAVGGTLELRPGVGGFTLIATVPADDRSGRPVDRVTLTS